MAEHVSNYWLDQIVDQALEAHPTGEILVSSGISPSASYHIGHFREALTADAIAWGLRQRGREARHLHVVDNFDPLRKRYHFLPEEFEQYVGWPICLVPDPFGCHDAYAQHFTAEFEAAAGKMGVEMDIIYSYEDQYKTGKMAPYIEQALAHVPEIHAIFKVVAHRDLPEDWVPIQIVSDSKSLNEWRYVSHNTEDKTLRYRRADGSEDEMRYDDGRVKLNWRLDWPARWALHGVRVEPFGKEHATKGGSYDTGAAFMQPVFGADPPLPLPYDTINLVGDTKKMSSSLGNLVTPDQALEIMPPEILRYFVLRSLPKRVVYFDPGLGVYNLIDEFSKLEEQVLAAQHPEFEQAYRVATAIKGERTISSVPFGHLVAVYQAARGDAVAVREILERTGYERMVAEQWPVIERELTYVNNWLAKHAPDSVIFSVQEKLPNVELSDGQRVFLAKLAETIEAEKDLNGQGMHDAIYAAAEAAGVKAAQAFVALYRVIIGQDSGPKAGWFLASLDTGWLVARLREAGESARVAAEVANKDYRVTLPDGRQFKIDKAISDFAPWMAVGYAVADVTVEAEGRDWSAAALQSLQERGLTRDKLTEQPEINVWREVYKQFGVKPSDYRSSVEALVRRTLDSKFARVNSVVDVYNYISVKHLLPMGAMDLDQVDGDIELRFGRDGETAELFGYDKPVPVTSRQVVYADNNRIISWLWNYRDAKDTAVTVETRRAIFFIDGLQGPESVTEAMDELVTILTREKLGKVIAFGVLS